MADLLKIEVTRAQLEEGIIPQNMVLCEMFYDNEGAKTKSGIIFGTLKDVVYADADNADDASSHAADLAEVCAIVVKLPQELYFNPEDEKSMPWGTDMELCEGDLVWTSPLETLNSVSLVCEGKIYKLLPYQDLYCAKREIWVDKWSIPQKKKTIVVMLNGFVLCEQLPRPKLSELDIVNNDTIDKTKGKVAYLGTPNKRHKGEMVSDFKDLKVGDEVLFDKKYMPFTLERTLYASKFDDKKLYFVVPRARIVAVIKREGE
jgi:co-chaperonin GroES (HSP10)